MLKRKTEKRILALCLTFGLCTVGVWAQRVSFNVNSKPLKTAVIQFKKATGYSFVFGSSKVNTRRKVTVNAVNQPIKSVVDKILEGQDVDYVIENNLIILKDRKSNDNSKNFTETRPAKKGVSKKVSGRIVDAKGEPIIGAVVKSVDGSAAAVTDINGNFTLVVPAGIMLRVSYIGYHNQDVKANDNMNITMQENAVSLNDIVVVGYGKQSRKLITTSVASLKVDDLDQGADYNVAKMLQGRAPGVSVSSPSGTPGSSPVVHVRGVGSISGSSEPLYVVDGIPSESMPVINPNDVGRVDVLKDASGAAIYGSRANNGVIIITTKTGKLNEKTVINASYKHSFGTIARDVEPANSAEYIRTMQAAVDNYNVQMLGKADPLTFFIPDKIGETNWLGVIQRDVAHTSTASLNIQGGSKKTSFFVSYGLNDQQGIIKRSNADQSNIRVKFGHQINSMLTLNLNLSGSYTRYHMVEASSSTLKVIRTAREEQPWIGPYDEDGNYTQHGNLLVRHNPLMILNEENWTLDKFQGVLSASADFTPIKGLKYTPTLSYYGILDNYKKSITEEHDYKARSGWGALTENKNQSHRIVFDNVLQYDNSWDKLIYSVMLGHSWESYAYETFGARSDNYANDAFPSSSFGLINAGQNIYSDSIGYNAYAIDSYFGRIALNWGNRYVLNAALRRDGSSRFPKNHRYGNFPSASFAWLLNNESFWKKNNIIDDFKLRLSWGNTGSMNGISNWSAISLVYASGAGYNGNSGFSIGQDAANVTWEKATEYNVGIDADFLSGRIGLEMDAFYQKTKGLLYWAPVIATSGYTGKTSNLGEMENKGLEVTLTGKIFQGDFNWTLTGNISWNRNKLLKLDGTTTLQLRGTGVNQGGQIHALMVGKPVTAFYMYRADGLYQSDAEVPEKMYNKGFRAGDVKYYDANGDGDITEADRVYCGKALPDIYGGITSTMLWKGFDFTVFCQYAAGGKVFATWKGGGGTEGTETLGGSTGSTIKGYKNGEWVSSVQYYNVSKYAANHYWHGAGTSNTVPRPIINSVFTGNITNTTSSTRYLEDASYFKFKTITLGYTLPKTVLKKLQYIKGCRLYVSLDNFFTLTKYDGYDPDASLNTSPLSGEYASDYGLEPTLKNIMFGIDIKL